MPGFDDFTVNWFCLSHERYFLYMFVIVCSGSLSLVKTGSLFSWSMKLSNLFYCCVCPMRLYWLGCRRIGLGMCWKRKYGIMEEGWNIICDRLLLCPVGKTCICCPLCTNISESLSVWEWATRLSITTSGLMKPGISRLDGTIRVVERKSGIRIRILAWWILPNNEFLQALSCSFYYFGNISYIYSLLWLMSNYRRARDDAKDLDRDIWDQKILLNRTKTEK